MSCRLRTVAPDLSSERFNLNDSLIRAVKDENYELSMANELNIQAANRNCHN
jgi:hypothetical protein